VKILVTGATGFVGRHLCRRLLEVDHQVVGTALFEREVAASTHPTVVCDVTRETAVADLVRDVAPDAIVHLAAIASVPAASADAECAYRVNVGGTATLLEAMATHAPAATFLAISSAEVYGKVTPADLPLRETQTLAPASVYAETKAAVEALADIYAGQLRIVVLRPFSHIGPGQDPHFVASSFAKQIADIEAGRAEPVLHVGNLEARRDFSDARDVVEAYRLAIDACESHTPYNICSGNAVAIQDVLDGLLALTDADIRVEQDPARLRASDVPVLEGCADKFTAATGWAPRIPFAQTLADTLDYWRKRTAESTP